jgi:tRNA G10  N-methylase Trm11
LIRMPPLLIKLAFIDGLREIVLDEISHYPDLHLIKAEKEELYFDFIQNFRILENLRSVAKIYGVLQDAKLNPLYISKHKSIVGNIIDIVLKGATGEFRTFKLTCAGSDSKEAKEIRKYIEQTYSLSEDEDADIKIHIIKSKKGVWEVGAQLTRRPLSVRDYKVENIKGGMNPTIAYAINALCDLDVSSSYLNVFSGSATLLIEAGRSNPRLRLAGFDKNKESVSLAIKNIKKAGLIKSIQLKALDIFDKPDLGKFDIITSDLPFGMLISKNEDLENLYRCFVDYSEGALNPTGKLVVYTSEHETLSKILEQSKFRIIKTLDLKFLTSVNAYLYPKIFVCKFK